MWHLGASISGVTPQVLRPRLRWLGNNGPGLSGTWISPDLEQQGIPLCLGVHSNNPLGIHSL